MNKQIPILFSGPMVRAILNGNKTQTRRVVKGQHQCKSGIWYVPRMRENVAHAAGANWMIGSPAMMECCPYGQPGDLLWVRESFVDGYPRDPATDMPICVDEEGNDLPLTVWYRATEDPTFEWVDEDDNLTTPPWRSSRYMPKKYCRLWLRVTDVRVERLQEISEKDAEAEGFSYQPGIGYRAEGVSTLLDSLTYNNARSPFRALWDSLNAKKGHGWDTNPWVWVISFERTEVPG